MRVSTLTVSIGTLPQHLSRCVCFSLLIEFCWLFVLLICHLSRPLLLELLATEFPSSFERYREPIKHQTVVYYTERIPGETDFHVVVLTILTLAPMYISISSGCPCTVNGCRHRLLLSFVFLIADFVCTSTTVLFLSHFSHCATNSLRMPNFAATKTFDILEPALELFVSLFTTAITTLGYLVSRSVTCLGYSLLL